MKIHHKILLGLNLILILLTFLAYLAPFVDPGKFYMLSFFGLVYPWLLILNICMIFLWLGVRKKYALFSLVTIIIGGSFATGFLNFSQKELHTDNTGKLMVSSYNMQYAFASYSRDPGERTRLVENYSSFLDTFKNMDILCVQETQAETRTHIENLLTFDYVHSIKGKGAAIYSRYPIVAKGEIDFGTQTNSCLWADIQIKSDTIRFYSVHLQSNHITDETKRVVETGTFGDSDTWVGVKGILAKYKTYVKRRSEQVKALYKHKMESPHKVIICGDLNDPPQSFVYRILRKNMRDSFKEKGNGIGATYAGLIPALRIDYIFTDKVFKINEHWVIREKYSDHFPIVSQIQLP